MNKPFDNETVRTKTTWTDEELLSSIALLDAAEKALDALGDRYWVVRDDIIQHHYTLLGMARSRGIL